MGTFLFQSRKAVKNHVKQILSNIQRYFYTKTAKSLLQREMGMYFICMYYIFENINLHAIVKF